jgi:hypothetical protein
MTKVSYRFLPIASLSPLGFDPHPEKYNVESAMNNNGFVFIL